MPHQKYFKVKKKNDIKLNDTLKQFKRVILILMFECVDVNILML